MVFVSRLGDGSRGHSFGSKYFYSVTMTVLQFLITDLLIFLAFFLSPRSSGIVRLVVVVFYGCSSVGSVLWLLVCDVAF